VEWRLESTLIKPFALHGSCQSVVSAITELKARHSIDPAQVESIRVKSSDRRVLLERFLDPSPTTLLGAQCSLPLAAGVALLRDLQWPLEFDESVLQDPTIRRIAGVTTFEVLDESGTPRPVEGSGWHIEVEVLANGTMLSVRQGPHLGSLANPASFEDVVDKFQRFSTHLLDDDRRASIIEMVRDLEHLEDAAELAGALRG
jgi:2-methylcitrate dehydratase PrpD